jgi:hypothetical protein
MKFLPLFLLLIAVVCTTYGQSFQISTTPRSQSVKVGESAKFSIKVTPKDGYDATVFSRAVLSSSGRQIPMQPDFLNAPYSGEISIQYEPLPADIGNRQILIEAWNGSLRVYDTVTVNVDGFPDRPGWRRYTTGNSPLPSDSIIALVFDTDGSAWIGTTKGLAKFDGKEWTVFRSMNNGDSVLGSDTVYTLAVDSSNVIWAGTPKGVSRRASNVWTMYKDGQGFASPDTVTHNLNIVSLATSPDLKIYAVGRVYNPSGGLTAQLWIREGENWGLTPVWYYVSQVAVDTKGRLYTLSQDTLTRYDGEFKTVYPRPANGRLGQSMDLDQNGNVWASVNNSLLKLESGEWKYIGAPASVSSYVAAVASDHASGAWVSNGYIGIAHYNGATWSVHDFSSQPHNSNYVTALRTHRDGTVWAGTYGGGLLVFNPDVASSVETPEKNRHADAGTLTILPNPATDISNVHLQLSAPGDVRVAVTNALGEEVTVLLDGSLEAGEHVLPLNTMQLPSGVYYVRMNGGGVHQVQTMIVAH